MEHPGRPARLTPWLWSLLILAAGCAFLAAMVWWIRGTLTWWVAVGLAVLALLVAWLARRFLGQTVARPAARVVQTFLGAVEAERFDQLHRLLTPDARERLPPGRFPVALYGHGAAARTAFLYGEVEVSLEWSLRAGPQHEAEVPVLIRFAGDRATRYDFHLRRSRGVWLLDGWGIDHFVD